MKRNIDNQKARFDTEQPMIRKPQDSNIDPTPDSKNVSQHIDSKTLGTRKDLNGIEERGGQHMTGWRFLIYPWKVDLQTSIQFSAEGEKQQLSLMFLRKCILRMRELETECNISLTEFIEVIKTEVKEYLVEWAKNLLVIKGVIKLVDFTSSSEDKAVLKRVAVQELDKKGPSPNRGNLRVGGYKGTKKEQSAISCLAPFDFVNFLFYFQALKIVKLKQQSHVIDVNISVPQAFQAALNEIAEAKIRLTSFVSVRSKRTTRPPRSPLMWDLGFSQYTPSHPALSGLDLGFFNTPPYIQHCRAWCVDNTKTPPLVLQPIKHINQTLEAKL
ncbi:hypothetical protein CR513_18275, partial [Mucuna pruriens]